MFIILVFRMIKQNIVTVAIATAAISQHAKHPYVRLAESAVTRDVTRWRPFFQLGAPTNRNHRRYHVNIKFIDINSERISKCTLNIETKEANPSEHFLYPTAYPKLSD